MNVVIHHVPESEASEEGYEAVAMGGTPLGGTPLGVSVEASDADSAPEALDRLLGALRVFGFVGSAQVEDVTYLGGVQRYELEGAVWLSNALGSNHRAGRGARDATIQDETPGFDRFSTTRRALDSA